MESIQKPYLIKWCKKSAIRICEWKEERIVLFFRSSFGYGKMCFLNNKRISEMNCCLNCMWACVCVFGAQKSIKWKYSQLSQPRIGLIVIMKRQKRTKERASNGQRDKEREERKRRKAKKPQNANRAWMNRTFIRKLSLLYDVFLVEFIFFFSSSLVVSSFFPSSSSSFFRSIVLGKYQISFSSCTKGTRPKCFSSLFLSVALTAKWFCLMLHNEEIGCRKLMKTEKQQKKRRRRETERNMRKEPKNCFVHMWLKFLAMPTQFDTHSPKRKLYKWATVNNNIPCTSFCIYVEQWSRWFAFLSFSGHTVNAKDRDATKETERSREKKAETENLAK